MVEMAAERRLGDLLDEGAVCEQLDDDGELVGAAVHVGLNQVQAHDSHVMRSKVRSAGVAPAWVGNGVFAFFSPVLTATFRPPETGWDSPSNTAIEP